MDEAAKRSYETRLQQALSETALYKAKYEQVVPPHEGTAVFWNA